VHHHARQRDTDSNYGTVFSFWDRLFASRSPTRRDPGMEIGVQGHEERSLAQLVLRPFLSAEMRKDP
jgi:sterol desaturase/sphingolipid hydroxylase (fatty acid hydroxylase superfamily)